MFFVYILKSARRDVLYKGFTEDLKKRFQEHNDGLVSSTKSGRPWMLLHYQAFQSKTDARREELFLKSGKGRERIKYLLRESLK